MSEQNPPDLLVNSSEAPKPPSENAPAQPLAPASITWDDPIKGYFLPSDVKCMKKAGNFDLSKKSDGSDNADGIYAMTSTKKMPKQMPPWTQQNPDPAHPLWTTEMCDNFKAWMDAGFP